MLSIIGSIQIEENKRHLKISIVVDEFIWISIFVTNIAMWVWSIDISQTDEEVFSPVPFVRYRENHVKYSSPLSKRKARSLFFYMQKYSYDILCIAIVHGLKFKKKKKLNKNWASTLTIFISHICCRSHLHQSVKVKVQTSWVENS